MDTCLPDCLPSCTLAITLSKQKNYHKGEMYHPFVIIFIISNRLKCAVRVPKIVNNKLINCFYFPITFFKIECKSVCKKQKEHAGSVARNS